MMFPYSMFLEFTITGYLVDIEPGLFEKSERMHFCAMKSCALVLVSQKNTERSSFVSKTGESWHHSGATKEGPAWSRGHSQGVNGISSGMNI